MLDPIILLFSVSFLSFCYFYISKNFRVYFLLFISFSLYGYLNINFLLILIYIIISTYLGSILIKVNRYFPKNLNLLLVIVLLMLPLFFFKYLVVWLDVNILLIFSNSKLFSFEKMIIPIGLSFYTFQSISYIVDVGRNVNLMQNNIFKLATFISFFPQILAGPIERWSALSNQLFQSKKPSLEIILDGLTILFYGLFLKIVLADRMSIYVDMIFVNYEDYNSFSNFLGLVLFFFQIFCDFAGYSLIAVGISKMFGINLSYNFKQPFFAFSLVDFWQRWHITLTKWVGDYIFKPIALYLLKKKINITFVEYFSLLATWILIGMWHGPTLNYALFGFMQFVFIILFRFLSKGKIKNKSFFNLLLDNFFTIFIVILTFGLIRSDDLSHYLSILTSLFNFNGFLVYPSGKIELLIGFSILIMIEWMLFKNFLSKEIFVKLRYNIYIRSFVFVFFIIIIYLLGFDDISAFIYFKY